MPEQERLFFESGDLVATPEDEAKIIDKCEKILVRIPELDAEISKKLEGWKIERLGKVELTILRLAVYEILFDEAVPAGAAINEAVDLAKKFGQDNSGQFINGILAGFAKE